MISVSTTGDGTELVSKSVMINDYNHNIHSFIHSLI